MRKMCIFLVICVALLSGTTSNFASNKSILIGIGDGGYKPHFWFEDDSLTPVGPGMDVCRQVFLDIGYEVQIIPLPWKRVLILLENGHIDATCMLRHTPDRERYATFTAEPLVNASRQLIVPTNSGINGVDDINKSSGLRVAAVRGWAYSIFDLHPNLERYDTVSEENMVRMVAFNRVAAGVGSPDGLRYFARLEGVQDAVRFVDVGLPRQYEYVAFSKVRNMNTLARRYSERLKQFKCQPAYAETYRKYGMDIPVNPC